MRDEPAREEMGAGDLAGGVEFDAVGNDVDPADPVPGNAHPNDVRREPAARGPAMITTSFARYRRQATDSDGRQPP